MSRALIRVAYVLLGLLTLATFGGYVLIGQVLKGGEHPGWPPDRPVEWGVFGGVTGAVVGLLLGLGVIWLMSLAGLRKEQRARARSERAVIGVALAALGLVAVSFAIGTLLSAFARTIAPRFGLVDKPGGRKAHRAPTPMGGGVAIWATTGLVLGIGAVALALFRDELPPELARHAGGLWLRGPELAALYGLATLIMVMGLIDDRVGLGWKPRLIVQIALASILVVVGVRATLFWPLDHPLISGAITVLWIVGLTNSFNFLDNMDGLAAGVGLIAALLFAAAQAIVGSLFVPAVLLVMVGALGGFLVFNRYPASLFMGDAGSNFLGFMLGALTVAGTFARPEEGFSPYGVLSPLLVMAVPLYDTTSVIWIRLREGRSPFRADRRHFSHRLVDRGLTPPQAVRTIDLVTLTGGLGTFLLPFLGALGALVVLAQTCCLLGVVAILEAASPGRPAAPASPSEPVDGEAKPRESAGREDSPVGGR